MALMALQASSFRAGFTFDCGFASMSDEKAYADLLAEGGLPLKLDAVAWTGGVEALGDVSSSVRLRGAVTVSRFSGSYEENYNPGGYILFGIITGGLGFLFGSPRDEVVTLENRSVNVEMSAYYKLTGNPSVSVGAGPMLAMVSRRIDTPNTSTSETGSGIGFLSGMRIDQESGKVLGLPLVFGAEGGYRVCDVKLDGDRTGDFSVDFSGPYFRVGTYLKF
jgi:hypothetical protein